MPVSDLTGTKWKINSTTCSAGYGSYYIDFSVFNSVSETEPEAENGTLFYIGYQYKLGGRPPRLQWLATSDSVGYVAYNEGGVLNSSFAIGNIIQITGGTDATNATLIAWLEANGTLTAPQPTPSTTNNIFFGTSAINKVYFGTSEVSKIYYGNTKVYEAGGEPEPVVENFLTFESDDGSEFTLGTNAGSAYFSYGFNNDGTLEYSTDKSTWSSWDPTTTLTSVNGKLYLRGSNNTYLSSYYSCFLPGTQITLADGTKKNVEDITYDDTLKVWDFDTGTYGIASICWLTRHKLKNYHYYKLTFSDGTILKTTGRNSNHKVYNVDEHYFKGVNKTEIGDRIFTENGIVVVTNKEYIEEEVFYYNLITSLKFGCFANGVLTSDRYGNTYPIDENMMFIKDGREIRPYSEFEEVGISRYWYDNLRLGEQIETLEETKQYIRKLECQMRTLEDN